MNIAVLLLILILPISILENKLTKDEEIFFYRIDWEKTNNLWWHGDPTNFNTCVRKDYCWSCHVPYADCQKN